MLTAWLHPCLTEECAISMTIVCLLGIHVLPIFIYSLNHWSHCFDICLFFHLSTPFSILIIFFYLSIYLPVVLFLSPPPPPPPFSTLLKRNLLFMLLNFSFWKIIAFSHRSQYMERVGTRTQQIKIPPNFTLLEYTGFPCQNINRVSGREYKGFPCQSIPGFHASIHRVFLARIYSVSVTEYTVLYRVSVPKIQGFPKKL